MEKTPADTEQTIDLTPNQVVSHNLWRTRLSLGITQAEAAERLEPHLGVRWSKATFSAAERGRSSSGRIRQFTADDIAAFARAFDVPILSFFLPPASTKILASRAGGPDGADAYSPAEFLELVVGTSGNDGAQKIVSTIDELLDQKGDTTPSQKAVSVSVERIQDRAVERLFADLGGGAAALRETASLLERAKKLAIKDEKIRRRQAELGDEL